MQVDQARAQIASVQIDHLITVQIHALIDNGNDLIILGQQDLVRCRLHLLGAIQQDPVRIGTFHWEHPLFFNFFGQELFYFSIARSGGFVTTNDQQVLNEDYQPIEGLYASGNTCGMRFGPEYITPIPGVSIGMCLTLGRELGKYLAAK